VEFGVIGSASVGMMSHVMDTELTAEQSKTVDLRMGEVLCTLPDVAELVELRPEASILVIGNHVTYRYRNTAIDRPSPQTAAAASLRQNHQAAGVSGWLY